MGKTVKGQIVAFKDRRVALQQAAELLAAHADYCSFVRSYARMNPAASHRFNSFYFGKPEYTSRAVIFGPWLYIHAPSIKLPSEVMLLSEKERREKHLGNLMAKVSLTSANSQEVVEKVIQAFKRGHKEQARLNHVEKVQPPQGRRDNSDE